MHRRRARPACGPAGIVLLLAVLAVTGCAPAGQQRSVETAARAWFGAVRDRDAGRLCQLLTPQAARSVASGGSCEQQISGLDLVAARVGTVRVWSDEAQVRGDRDTLFLTQVRGAWKISAAGCTPQPDRPYECLVEG